MTESAVEVPAGAAALAKGLTLLNIVADANEPLRFAELQRLSGHSKPTFSRILRTLMAFGLVRQNDSNGTYVLGPRFLELSHRVWDTFDLGSAAIPELESLSRQLGETIALCKLDDLEVQYIDERSGAGLSVRVDTGRRAPVHCTAAGKVLMAFQDPAVSRAMTANLPLTRFTDSTLTDKTALIADLTVTRARGYAVSFEEHLDGVNSVAVAIAGQDGTPMGALVALGPSSRLDQSRIHPVGRDLIAAARRITGSAGAIAISSHPRPRNRQSTTTKTDLDCILPWGAQLGEAPVWHSQEGKLYWVDILHPALYRYDPVSGVNESCAPGKLVSAVLPSSSGGVYIATQDGIESLDFETGSTSVFAVPDIDRSNNRLNDAKVSPSGAIWVGSMRLDASKPTGGLFRISDQGVVETKETEITVANGLDWSPDAKTFYFVDTIPGVIYTYDCEPGTGRINNRRIFTHIPESEGRPDGLTVDSEGGVWCAIWDGWCVRRYTPDGQLDRVVDMPIPRPTSVAFGGTDLSTMYVTSARTRLPASTLSESPLSGGLFCFTPGETGVKPKLFRANSAC